MSAKNKDIFIVNRNPVRLEELNEIITNRFGLIFETKRFNDNNSAINAINKQTKIIVFDNSLESFNKETTLLTMKNIYTSIKSIMCTSNEEIEMAIDDYCKRKSFHLFRKGKTWERVKPYFDKVVKPTQYFVREYFVRKYVLVFLLTFMIMGIGIYCLMNY